MHPLQVIFAIVNPFPDGITVSIAGQTKNTINDAHLFDSHASVHDCSRPVA